MSEFSIEHYTSRNMGDHGQEVTVSHAILPGETVEALARRIFKMDERFQTPDPADFIAIRIVVPAPPLDAPWSHTPAPAGGESE